MKNIALYTIIIGVFLVPMYFIIVEGRSLTNVNTQNVQEAATVVESGSFLKSVKDNLHHPLAVLLMQVLVIMLISRVFGIIAGFLGQQNVIGEMIAGIVMGPSVLGYFFPELSAFIFPPDSLKTLQFLSQLGLLMFMFIIGMELDINSIKTKAKDALVISHSSIVFPYFLGVALAYFIYENYAPANVNFLSFSLFMGIAMSITAFPVLAKILKERNLMKTPLGSLAITCAAADDVSAWCILAFVIAITKSAGLSSAVLTIALAIVFVLIMLMVVKPSAERIYKGLVGKKNMSGTIIALSFLVLLISALISEVIGIHALFGAFLAGVCMPHVPQFRHALTNKMEDFSVVLLLPIFFAFVGLRTKIGLLNEGHLWVLCAVVFAVAIVGKFAGSATAAKLVGRNWYDALSIGALMNTRGLMELVVLNIGYDLGILTPEIFAIMVIMALGTTFMTGPSLNILNRVFRKSAQPAEQVVA